MSAPASNRILGFRECQVLELLTADIATDGAARSYRAMAIALGMSARHHVADTVRRLERRGLITRVGEGRGRRIVMACGNCVAAPDPVKGSGRKRCANG